MRIGKIKYKDAEAVEAVEAAGLDLATGKNIKLIAALAADHTWTGFTVECTAGEDISLGEVVYLKSDTKCYLADADEATTMPVKGIATADIANGAQGTILLWGFFRDDTWNWTIGGLLYASVTPGAISQTAPVGSGDQVQALGVAVTADIIRFLPSFVTAEVT